MALVDNFEKMLASGKDTSLLRFSLGNEYMKLGQAQRAAEHLRAAVALDPGYSAAWKLLGKALTELGENEEAISSYHAGVAAADKHGDKQAAKEMTVFKRRLEKAQHPDTPSEQDSPTESFKGNAKENDRENAQEN